MKMEYYYIDASNQLQGPLPFDQLRNLLETSQINLTTLVNPVGAQHWIPFREILKEDAIVNAKDTSRYFRLSSTGSLKIKEIPVLKKNQKVVFLKDYAVFSDGTRKKMLLRGTDDGPTTPIKAIQSFINAQKQAVAMAKSNYEKELALLERAEKMLEEAEAQAPEKQDSP